jgi:hypothetical protein
MAAHRNRDTFDKSVFINCPFDSAYTPLLRPLLFTVIVLGFRPCLASDQSDSTEYRLDKILGLIRKSRLSIHDISRLKATGVGDFARFNLPFELGLAHASRVFGPMTMRRKRCLILEREPHDFRRALSDLAGGDIKAHGDEPQGVVRSVRNWFVETVGLRNLPSPTQLWYRFTDFTADFYETRKAQHFSEDDLNMMPTPEYADAIRKWVSINP